MSLKNYETIIINTVTGPSLGHRYVITAINEQKKVKRNRIIFVTRDADKKKNSTITLLVNMNLIAFGWAKIFVTLNRSDKFLVDSTWSPFLTHNVQWTQSQATGEMENELTLWLYWRCGRGTYTDIDRTFRKKVQPASSGSIITLPLSHKVEIIEIYEHYVTLFLWIFTETKDNNNYLAQTRWFPGLPDRSRSTLHQKYSSVQEIR